MKKKLRIYEGGSTELKSYNPYDGGTLEFKGNSHAKGGIKMSFDGNPAEVEGGETAVQSPDGGLMIMGNMNVPGTKTKFKQVSKAIAKKENHYQKLLDKGSELVDKYNTTTKFDRLKFKTGYLLMDGAAKGQLDLSRKKADLSTLQQAMLETSYEMGIDPIAMSEGKVKQFKHGGKKYAPGGDPSPKKQSVAQRHNNPGNIKFNPKLKWMIELGAVKGEAAKDGGNFAKFPDVNSGLKAIQENLRRGYGKYSVEDAIKRWTNNEPYKLDLGSLKGKKVSDLSDQELGELQNIITQGEDGKFYNFPVDETQLASPLPATPTSQPTVVPPQDLPRIPNTTFGNPNMALRTAMGSGVPQDQTEYTFNTNQRKAPIFRTPFDPFQIAPEVLAVATNRPEYVPMQQFTPDLFEQYNVSFQDRLNENQASFSAAQRMAAFNPSMMGNLTAQKYAADSQVAAEEFRTNQAIQNDITNRNVSLLNDAQLKNLAIADQQMVRQSQARSRTKATLQSAINSMTSKYLQHKQANSELGFYQELFDYRPSFDDKGRYAGLEYMGPEQTIGRPPVPGTTSGSIANEFQSKTVQKRLPDGSFERVNTPSMADQQLKKLQLMQKSSPNKLLKIFGVKG